MTCYYVLLERICVQQKEKRRVHTMKKNTIWVVSALTAIEPGKLVWMDFKTFKSAIAADDWICDYCRKNGYSITDFNLVAREA
nr:MAG TPA: hypothetical protein [Caudoviricetes sp.]